MRPRVQAIEVVTAAGTVDRVAEDVPAEVVDVIAVAEMDVAVGVVVMAGMGAMVEGGTRSSFVNI
jgi:hypothetical protein